MPVDTRIHWPSPEIVAVWSVLSALGLRPGRALELGCGFATESLFLASQGWDVVAIDKDAYEVGLARARVRRLPKRVQRRVTLLEGDAIDFREEQEGGFDLVIDRLLFSNLYGDGHDVYSRAGKTHARNRLELIETAAWALAPGGLFVLRMRQWRDAVEPFEPEGGRDTLSRRELKHAGRWFRTGTELGYTGFSTPDGANRKLKKLALSIRVMRRLCPENS